MWVRLRDENTNMPYFYNTETEQRSEKRPSEGFRLYHILIKHEGSRRPVGLPFEAALARIKGIYEELGRRINESDFKNIFKDVASKHSQCSSAKRGGDLGFVCGNEMLKEFEKPAFALRRGEMVGPVSTPSGLHIIYRG